MKKLLYVSTLLYLFVALAMGQFATVSRNVNLRSDPSTGNASLTLLAPGTQVQLLERTPTNHFLHVKTDDGTEGWVWSRNVHVEEEATPATATTGHVGPIRLYPDATMTPGLADTLAVTDLTKSYTENCPAHKLTCTYSQSHRNVPSSVHTHVYVEYDVPQNRRNGHDGEVDHFHPLCAGGSNDIRNLWYQPAVNDWNGKDFGFHAKDKLETFVCAQIKAGNMNPQDAFERITRDWVKFYLDEGLDDEN